MLDYDFQQLSHHEFEQLSRDILQARDGIVLESFKRGRDSGIDFRYARDSENTVVQCKHYVGTGWNGLLAELKREAGKAHALNPSDIWRYAYEAQIEYVIQLWAKGETNLSEGIALLESIEMNSFVFPTVPAELRVRALRLLATEASTGCSSAELRELVNAIASKDLTGELVDLLHKAADVYKSSYFSDELVDCNSEGNFDDLEADLLLIEEFTGVDFRGPLKSIHAEKEEFEENQAAYEDQQYEEWNDSRYEREGESRQLDDMFDSLRLPEADSQ